MRQKFTVLTSVCLCLVLGFGMASATERERDYQNDGSKQRIVNGDPIPNGGAIDMQQTFADQTRRTSLNSRVDNTGQRVDKAALLLQIAAGQTGDDQIGTLNRVLSFDMPATPEADKIRFEALRLMGVAYEGTPSKQVSLFAQALQFADTAGSREWLQTQINTLGGDVVDLAFGAYGTQAFSRTVGVGDTCDVATPAGLDTVNPLDILDAGDSDFYAVDVNTASGGALVRFETITDDVGGFSDDTDLTLWGACNAGVAENQLAFNDDGGTSGGFMSLIETGCLSNGTYYVEVGGWADIGIADNITLDITTIEECIPPTPDDFEPDDDRENASKIGRLVSGNPFGLFKGTIKKEIQAHNFFPAGDVDFVKFLILRSELVNMETACQFPTVFNDFTSCDVDADGNPDTNPDTQISLLQQTESNYGGLCNSTNTDGAIVGGACREDLDCDLDGDGDPLNDLIDPIDGFPPCLDWSLFSNPPFGAENALAFNDDIEFPANPGSRLTLCMPGGLKFFSGSALVQNDPAPGPKYYWYVRANPFDAGDFFEYEIFVHNEATCNFEEEPNQDFADATRLPVDNTSMHGIFEYSETFPFQDSDLFEFDVDAGFGFDGTERLVTFETFAYDDQAADTALELLVGPDENGDYFTTGVADEDGGQGFLSRIDVILPTADDLLGITLPADVLEDCLNPAPSAPWWWPPFLPWWGDWFPAPDYCGPSYFMEVTSNYLNPNFPYELSTTFPAPPIAETEPNNDDASANAGAIGDTFAASIDPGCDVDVFSFTITEDTEVSISSAGAGIDTAIQLVECGNPSVLACDDDGGDGLLSLVTGCLPPGVYCAQVRAFDGADTFDYNLEIGGGDACIAETPPVTTGDGAFTCTDFETCP